MPHTFIITGTGRAGSQWLADFLNTAGNTVVYHEPFGNEGQACINAYHGNTAEAYIDKRREWIDTHLNAGLNYGEVNGYLRFHTKAIKAVLDCPVYLLIRDGRDVVRSGFSRKTYKPGHMTEQIEPKPGDPFFYNWLSMTRFERICWHWQMVNEYLADKVEDVLKFEDMLNRWPEIYWFTRQLGIEVRKDVWEEKRKHKRNAMSEYTLPHHTEWDADLTEQFWRICGETMAKYGYERG